MPKPIFDSHTHVGICDPFHYSSLEETSLSTTVESLISEMDKHSVAQAVVMPNFRLPHRLNEANLALASAIKNFRDRLVGFAWLDPRIEDCCEQLESLAKEQGFRGLKLHPVLGGYYLSNKVVFPLIENSIRLGLPVMIHTGWGSLGSASDVGQLAERFRDATFIMAHMVELASVNVTKKNENIFLETSYAQHPRRITQAAKTLGADRLLYGSDYPLGGGMEFELSKIILAELTDQEKIMILGENMRRLTR